MTEQDRRFHRNAGKDGRLTVPAATRRALGWSPGSTVYITMDGQTLMITDKEQIGKQNHTLTIHRRGAIILTPFVLPNRSHGTAGRPQGDLDGERTHLITALTCHFQCSTK